MEGISVIICCYNSAQRLPETINHLKAQENLDGIAWEILIVNNNSNDNTEEIANSFLVETTIKYKIIQEPKPGLFYARITGINESSYDTLIFVDDDNWLNKDYLLNAYNIMLHNPSVGLCGGIGEGVFEVSPPIWFKYYERGYAIGNKKISGILPRNNCFLFGAGLVIRKQAYLQLQQKGFQPILVGRKEKFLSAGDDSELCVAINLLGWHSYLCKNLNFKHYVPAYRLTWDYLLKMAEGFGSSSYIMFLYSNILNKKRPFLLYFLKYIINNLFYYFISVIKFKYFNTYSEFNKSQYNIFRFKYSLLSIHNNFSHTSKIIKRIKLLSQQ